MITQSRISPAAFRLIVQYETGGEDYYDKVYRSRPVWPGFASGVTIGCGEDLGYMSVAELYKRWQKHLIPEQLGRLQRCIGKTGSAGKQALSGVRDIEIPFNTALKVFVDGQLPWQIRNTLVAFPGSADKLSANAFGALVSLVFNRGTSMDGERRKEMQAIRSAILSGDGSPDEPNEDLHRAIAKQVRAMKRLWKDTESDGDLADRREAEAKLILTPDEKTFRTPASAVAHNESATNATTEPGDC